MNRAICQVRVNAHRVFMGPGGRLESDDRPHVKWFQAFPGLPRPSQQSPRSLIRLGFSVFVAQNLPADVLTADQNEARNGARNEAVMGPWLPPGDGIEAQQLAAQASHHRQREAARQGLCADRRRRPAARSLALRHPDLALQVPPERHGASWPSKERIDDHRGDPAADAHDDLQERTAARQAPRVRPRRGAVRPARRTHEDGQAAARVLVSPGG